MGRSREDCLDIEVEVVASVDVLIFSTELLESWLMFAFKQEVFDSIWSGITVDKKKNRISLFATSQKLVVTQQN